MVNNKLQLSFGTADQKKYTIQLSDANGSLTDVEVATAMDEILTANIFVLSGAELTSKATAKMISTTDYDVNA